VGRAVVSTGGMDSGDGKEDNGGISSLKREQGQLRQIRGETNGSYRNWKTASTIGNTIDKESIRSIGEDEKPPSF